MTSAVVKATRVRIPPHRGLGSSQKTSGPMIWPS